MTPDYGRPAGPCPPGCPQCELDQAEGWLADLTRGDTVKIEPHPLAAARGCLYGLALSVALAAGVGLLLAVLL